MSSKPQPTLVFIPGAGHLPETWNKVISILKEHQLRCVAVELPTTMGDPSKGLEDDINAVRAAIAAETSQGRDVVIVVHSYGGAVGQSAIKGLTRPKADSSAASSDTNTSSGYVIGFVSMASGFGETGMSFLDNAGGKPPPSWRLDPSGFAVFLLPQRELFYHDLPEEEGDYWVSKLTKHSQRAFTEGGEFAYAGWRDVPVWYLITVNDQALPAEVQRMMDKMVRDAGGDITTREIESSHSPMLSKPKETAEFILDAVKAFVK